MIEAVEDFMVWEEIDQDTGRRRVRLRTIFVPGDDETSWTEYEKSDLKMLIKHLREGLKFLERKR